MFAIIIYQPALSTIKGHHWSQPCTNDISPLIPPNRFAGKGRELSLSYDGLVWRTDFSDSEWKSIKHKVRRVFFFGLLARKLAVYQSPVRILRGTWFSRDNGRSAQKSNFLLETIYNFGLIEK